MGGQRDIKGRENTCYLFGGKRLGNCIFFSQNASTYLCIVSSSGYRMHPQEQAFKEEPGLCICWFSCSDFIQIHANLYCIP